MFCVVIQISLKFVPEGLKWELVSIGLGNDWLPAQWQAISRTNADLLSVGTQGANLSEI